VNLLAPPTPNVTERSVYDVVLTDPPWSYTGQQDKQGAAAKHYPTMTDAELAAFTLPVDMLAPKGVLFMWATAPRLDAAMLLLDAWGLTYRGTAFVWVKTRKSDPLVPIGAQGVRPSIVKPTCEFVLAASRVRKGRPLPVADESISQVVLAPKGAHSAKPDAVQERIEALYPNASRIEFFARTRRPGWEAWGNEISADHAAVPLAQHEPAPVEGVR
jgi:N6-adenosine-specific RNA methylase IME4